MPPSPVTMHLLSAPDLGKQSNKKEEDENVQKDKASVQSPDEHPRRRNYQRKKKPVRRTRKRTTPRLLETWKRFTPTKLLKKAKMMLRSVQSE